MESGLVLDKDNDGKEEELMVNGEQHWPELRNLIKHPFVSKEWYHTCKPSKFKRGKN